MKRKLTAIWNKRILPMLKDPLFLSKWVVSDYIRGVEQGRTTVWVNGGYKTLVGDYGGELFMFLQDMHQGIMPYTRVRGGSYAASLLPTNQELEQIITEALSERGNRRELRDALEDFIRRATQSLFFYSETFYEIACERDADGKITKIEFFDIYPPSMKKVFGQYFQIIPWSAAKHARIKAGIHRIPKERILYIEYPKQLGGKGALRKIVKRLATISKTIMPDFQMKAMEKNENSGFNFEQYHREKYIEIAQLTRKLGWNQRKIRDDGYLEYYEMHRHLMFADSQAILRQHILEKVNQALNGTIVNAKAEITVENLLTQDDVKAEFELLRKGDLEFSELVKRTTWQ